MDQKEVFQCYIDSKAELRYLENESIQFSDESLLQNKETLSKNEELGKGQNQQVLPNTWQKIKK